MKDIEQLQQEYDKRLEKRKEKCLKSPFGKSFTIDSPKKYYAYVDGKPLPIRCKKKRVSNMFGAIGSEAEAVYNSGRY